MIKPKDMDVVVLCGGKGRRLQSVINDRPKPMAKVAGEVFLDILLRYLASFGFRRFILCVCHMGGFIKEYYQNRNSDFTILFSEEVTPLGTAGAIKKAKPFIKSNPFLAVNGDSLCALNLNKFLDFYLRKNALFSIVLSSMAQPGDYGSVDLDKSSRVKSFNEKAESITASGLANAGIYLLDRSIFKKVPENKKCSIEYEVFPKLTKERFYGFVTNAKFFDIGTPERFKLISAKGEKFSNKFS